MSSCSNKKNTAVSRMYHSVNTRYNSHFNANEAYKESIKAKEKKTDEDDNLSRTLHVYPEILDSADLKFKGTFTTTIDKTTKAIKLHSIKTRPQRDPNKHRDEKYQQWLKQKEFNPFLINTWMLLAKAEFQEGSYLRSITTFMYITKIYEGDPKIVSESKLWIARAYAEMGWRYEAENVLRKMEQNDEIHHQLLGMYAAVKANMYVRSGNYESAIPYLEEAIKKGKKESQKRRNRYLLGQLYAKTGDNQKAYKAFASARGFSAPYNYIFNSKLRQLEVSNYPDAKMISELKKMTRGAKNKEYLDQVYTSIGNIYLNSQDTVKAVENYAKAIKESKREGYDKALAQIKLGALYFNQKKYVKAQPCYSEALPQLSKTDEHYPLVALRSEVLDQLVVHAKVVYEQDSLLLLASMPEMDRTAVIEKYIEELKKEEARKKKEAELERRNDEFGSQPVSSWDDLDNRRVPVAQAQPQPSFGGQQTQDGSDFYFYNAQAVEQGKISFQKQWGRRTLEDNWRRTEKTSSNPFGDNNEDDLLAEEDKDKKEEDKEGDEPEEKEVVTDKYSVEYYVQQLPLTDAAKEAAYKLVENGLFNMGLIYKNLLEDNHLAIETFETDLSRFPNTPNKEEIYFQLFLIYLQMGDNQLMASYRNKLINEFPKSKYAAPLSDENYAWNFKYMSKMQEDIYQETYAAYLAGNVDKVRKNYEEMHSKFPFIDLMPKFAFLNALSYAQTKDAPELEKNLTKLIADYPKADVIPMATNILKNIKDGMILLSDGTPIRSLDWTMAYSGDSVAVGDSVRPMIYLADEDKPYMLLLMFKPKSIDRNELLYQVADYNFSNYVIQTYDLKFDENPILSSLEMTGFESFKTMKAYLKKALLPDGLLNKIDKEIIPVPISADNYSTVFPRLGLEEYMTFYTDSLGTETPQLLAYWAKDYDKLLATTETEETKEEVAPKEPEQETKPEVQAPETGEEKITFPDREEPQKEKTVEEKQDDKEANLEDVLSEEQVKIIGDINQKSDDIIESINNLGTNPVEGLKNIFNRNKIEDNLTKEEKAELKQQQKEEKERQKELQKQVKAKEDSIAKIEKIRLDSIAKVEKAVEDSIQATIKQEKDRVQNERKERENQLKQQEEDRKRQVKEREDARQQQQKDREDLRKQQEKARLDKLRETERKRDELMKQREQQRKDKEKEADERRKQREQERQEQLKHQERDRKARKK